MPRPKKDKVQGDLDKIESKIDSMLEKIVDLFKESDPHEVKEYTEEKEETPFCKCTLEFGYTKPQNQKEKRNLIRETIKYIKQDLEDKIKIHDPTIF